MLNSSHKSSPGTARTLTSAWNVSPGRARAFASTSFMVVVGRIEKGERHPAIAVDERGCGGRRWVRLEHHAIRVNDVVALDGVGEHQLVAVCSGRRGALGRRPCR